MRITFVCDTMSSGGAERVISSLANSFSSFGHDVTIIMLAKRADKSFYELADKVTLVGLTNSLPKEPSFFKKSSILRKTINGIKPDIVISFLSYVCIYTWWALRHTSIPYIVSERNDPNSRGRLKQFLLNKSFRGSSGCVFQTNQAREWYGKICSNKSVVIYNPVDLTFAPPKEKVIKKQILYVGRLTKQKNCQLLIEAFLKFHQKHNDYHLTIYGEGEMKDEITTTISNNDASKFVKLLPPSKTWQADEFNSTMFVLPSKYEGMPNVLAESLCLGIPSVATDCRIGGPKELKHVFPQLLTLCEAQDIDSLVSAMEETLKIEHQSAHIPDELEKTFIAKQWMKFIEETIKQK